METVSIVSPLIILSPVVPLVLGALLLWGLRRLALVGALGMQLAAAACVLGSLLATLQEGRFYAPLRSFAVGPLVLPILDLATTPMSLAWARLALGVGLAAVLVLEPGELPGAMVFLAVALLGFFAGGFPALCLSWLLVELALSVVFPAQAIGLHQWGVLSGTVMVAALFGGVSIQGLLLSQEALPALTWALAVLGVICRAYRCWGLSAARRGGASLLLAVALLSGCYALARVGLAARQASLPLAFLLLSFLAAGRAAWVAALRLTMPAQAALAMLLLILAAAVLAPPAEGFGAACAYAVLAFALGSVLSAMGPLARWRREARLVLAALPALCFVPLPGLPFGSYAIAAGASLAHGFSAVLAVIWAVLAGVSLSALSVGLLRVRTGEVSAPWGQAAAVVTLGMLASVAAFPAAFQEGGSAAPEVGAWELATPLLILGVAVVAAWRSTSLLASRGVRGHADRDAALVGLLGGGRWRGVLLGLRLLARLVEGEAALSWPVLVGLALLALAAGTI